MVSKDAMDLLRRIHGKFPDPCPVAWESPGLDELRDADLIDLYDMGPQGEAQWTATREGKAALSSTAT